MSGMIVLRQTPKGWRLLPLARVQGAKGQALMKSDPIASRVGEVMDYLMVQSRPFSERGVRPSLWELWDLLLRQYGEDFFPDVKYLSSTGETPARLIVTP